MFVALPRIILLLIAFEHYKRQSRCIRHSFSYIFNSFLCVSARELQILQSVYCAANIANLSDLELRSCLEVQNSYL